MIVILLRHAKARSAAGYGDDLVRMLDVTGLAQARLLAGAVGDLLARERSIKIVTSPAIRCRDTVDPLAVRFGLEVQEDWRLLETANDIELQELADVAHTGIGGIVYCGHAPSLSRLAQIISTSEALSVPAAELQLGVASFVSFVFGEGSSHQLQSVSRYLAAEYKPIRIVG